MEPIYSQSSLDIAFIEIKKNFIESNKHKNWNINLCQISPSYLSRNPLLEEYILKSLNQQHFMKKYIKKNVTFCNISS